MITRLGGPLTALCALVRAFVGLLVELSGPASVASAEATSAAPRLTYAYDNLHHRSLPTEATNERGLPGWVADITAHGAA